MEAPEKIYLQQNTTTDCYEEWCPEWFEARAKDTDIEYIRTDAFIEKIENYLNSQLYDWVSITNPDQMSHPNVIPKKDFIEDFKDYMKGE